jgi:hypothetical protein
MEKDKQPGEDALSKIKRTTSPVKASKTLLSTHQLMLRTHAGHQPKEIDAEIRRLLGKLVDLREQQRKASSKENNGISCLQGALGYTGHSTQRGLFESGKLSNIPHCVARTTL